MDKVYPLYFLFKHLRTCSPREITPHGNLIPFPPKRCLLGKSCSSWQLNPLLLRNLFPFSSGKLIHGGAWLGLSFCLLLIEESPFFHGHLNCRSYLETKFFSFIMSMGEKENLKKRWNFIFFG